MSNLECDDSDIPILIFTCVYCLPSQIVLQTWAYAMILTFFHRYINATR